MAAPLPGYLYHDENLFGGHYFIVGPVDPAQVDNVIIFCCTSKKHDRPSSHGCHSSHELPSFHIETGKVPTLNLPTWVQLDEVYFYAKTDFQGHWFRPRDTLDLALTVDLLACASESMELAEIDAQACGNEAESLRSVLN